MSNRSAKSANRLPVVVILLAGLIAVITLVSCGRGQKAEAESSPVSEDVSVGVTKVDTRPLSLQLTTSSELVPFQQIDVYAKESGYVKALSVDYGTRVKAGQVMAVLEIPELELQLQQDDAAIKSAADQVMHARHEIKRSEAQHNVLHLQYERLDGVSKTKPGLVAQQEVDEAQGKDLAAESQVEAAKSTLETAQSQLDLMKAKRQHDQVLFDYAKITAPFAGVVTERYANLGTLMQAGTNSSTQAMPLVRLSEDDRFRLVIPVPESYVRFIHVNDPVSVRIPSRSETYPGKVARFSVDVKEDTRTMHTEVDVPNGKGTLIPGMYAEATLLLEKRENALAVPLQAVSHQGDQTSVLIVDQSNKIVSQPVKLGIQTDRDAEVLSGLRAGDLVVVSDRAGLKPGQPVRPQMVDLMQYKGTKEEQ
jgi:RND family efflux transporter MFP subunit